MSSFYVLISLFTIGAMISLFLVSRIFSVSLDSAWVVLTFPLGIGAILIGIGLYYGLVKALLAYYDAHCGCAPLAELFSCFKWITIFRLLGAIFLYWIGSTLGSILIIPGIFFAVRFQFAMYYIIDKKCRIIESFKQSYRLTQGSFWRLLAVDILYIIFFNSTSFMLSHLITGFVASWWAILGILISFFTLPAGQLMLIYCYRTLQKNKAELADSGPKNTQSGVSEI